MSYRVSVTGIDGSGKSSIASNVTDKLSDVTVARIGRPTYITYPETGRRNYFFSNPNKLIDSTHSMADRAGSKYLVALVNFASCCAGARLSEWICDRYNPDIALYVRDLLIDPAVYATFYLPFTKKWTAEERLNLSRRFFGFEPPDLTIYVDVEPEIAVERIEKRILEERGHDVERNKWRHMHENVDDLTSLRNYYLEALEILYKDPRFNIRAIDSSHRSGEDVAAEVLDLITSSRRPVTISLPA